MNRTESKRNAGDSLPQHLRKFVSFFALVCLSTSAIADNTAATPLPRAFPTNWVTRHDEILERKKQGDIELLFLGDSITECWRWDKGGLNVWNRCYANRKAANFGVGWDRTQHVLWRMELGELEGLRPKVAVLLIGTNNCGNEEDGKPRNSAAEIADGITAIVRKLRAKLPETKVLLVGIFPRGEKNDPIRQQVKEINSRIAKLDDGRTVRFLDIGSKLTEADGTIPKDVMPDLLHLSEKGYQIWADAMEPTLAEMMK